MNFSTDLIFRHLDVNFRDFAKNVIENHRHQNLHRDRILVSTLFLTLHGHPVLFSGCLALVYDVC